MTFCFSKPERIFLISCRPLGWTQIIQRDRNKPVSTCRVTCVQALKAFFFFGPLDHLSVTGKYPEVRRGTQEEGVSFRNTLLFVS